jgi:hypothetical protein
LPVATAVLAVLTLLLTAGAGWSWWRSRDADRSSAQIRSESSATPSGETTAPATPESSAATSAGPTSPAASVPPTAVLACAKQVAAGEALATAVASSYQHWSGHVQAQLDLDAKRITAVQTKARWAATKVGGPEDLRRFDQARAALARVGTPCRTLDAAASGSWAKQAGGCTRRAERLTAVTDAGTVVHRQWAAHLDMMANKDHADMGAYLARWRRMVTAAGPAFTTYRAAARDLKSAPACEIPST